MGHGEKHSSTLHRRLIDGETAPALIRESSRRGSLWHAAAWMALLLYGSLLPFDIHPSRLVSANGFGLTQIGFHDVDFEDVVVNLLVYFPLGLSVAAGIAPRRTRSRSAWTRMTVVVLISGVFSIVIEAMQTASPSRVASWTDVAINTLGAATGAMPALCLSARVRFTVLRFAQSVAEHPFHSAAFALTIALFAYHLVPFDFVTTTHDLHASFSRARILPIRFPDPSAFAPAAHWIGESQRAAWFLLLGYLLALAGREKSRHSMAAFTSAVRHGVGLAGLIEFMQLFTRSHVFDSFSVVLRAIAVGFGAWCAAFVVDAASHSQWRRRPGLAAPTSLFAVAALFQAALFFVPAIGLQGWSTHSLRPSEWFGSAIHILPFESLWRAPAQSAAADVVSKLTTYSSLVFTLSVILRRLGVIRVGLVAGACTLVLAALAEILRSATGAHTPDGTVVILAVFSGLLVCEVDRLVRTARTLAGRELEPRP